MKSSGVNKLIDDSFLIAFPRRPDNVGDPGRKYRCGELKFQIKIDVPQVNGRFVGESRDHFRGNRENPVKLAQVIPIFDIPIFFFFLSLSLESDVLSSDTRE